MPEPPEQLNSQLSQAAAEDQIHELARRTANIGLTMHAKERMQERDINSTDLYRILRQGMVEQDPEIAKKGSVAIRVELACISVAETADLRDGKTLHASPGSHATVVGGIVQLFG